MGIQKFQIVFDRASKEFKSNQPVTGKILLSLNSPKTIRALMVHFKGEASIKWDETKETKNTEGNTVYETIAFTGNEIYFENKFNIVGGPSGVLTLQTGEYSYPFNIFLPPNLPSSFEGKSGSVRYTAKAIIDCPGEANSETHEKLTVTCPLDLKEHKTAKDPVKRTEEHFFCCCCCQSGPLTVVASIPFSGCVPGQELPLTVEVDNISQEEISGVRATLQQTIKFYSTSPSKSTKSEHTNIQAIILGSVDKNGSATWTKPISIPLLPASDCQHCSLIDIKYELEIVAEVEGMCHSNAEVTLPLTIGTIPLAGVSVADEFIIDDATESNVEIGSNFNISETAQGMTPSPIGFHVPSGGGMPMPMPGQAQPVFPPPYNTQGMYVQPNVGLQMNMGHQPGMPPYMGIQPGMQANANVMQPQMGMGYNPNIGNINQPNMAMLPPQNVPYQGITANIPAVHGQPRMDFIPQASGNTYQNASAPTQ